MQTYRKEEFSAEIKALLTEKGLSDEDMSKVLAYTYNLIRTRIKESKKAQEENLEEE